MIIYELEMAYRRMAELQAEAENDTRVKILKSNRPDKYVPLARRLLRYCLNNLGWRRGKAAIKPVYRRQPSSATSINKESF